jgi:hypothetical protein
MYIKKVINKIINKKKNLLISLKILKVLIKKEGLFVATIHLVNYFFYIFFNNKMHIDTPLEKYKKFLSAEIVSKTNKKIISGLYESVYLNYESHWNISDFSSKLLGFYEQQVQEKITELQKKYSLSNIVNIGAGEGYHIVSLIKNKFFEKGLAYEINTKGQNIIKKNLLDNNISDKVSVFGEGNFYSINKNIKNEELKKTLFLIDIEGNEFKFFNEENINYFNKSFFIIEDHSDLNAEHKNESEKKFFSLIKNHFIVTTIKNQGRNPFSISLLEKYTDDERYLMMSEGRPNDMQWLILVPKL